MPPAPAIDDVLAQIDAQSAFEFLAPLRHPSLVLAPCTADDPSSLVQIQGPPSSGKTSLLLCACIEALVPSSITLPFSLSPPRVIPPIGASSHPHSRIRQVRIHLGGQARRTPHHRPLVHLYDPLSRFPLQKLRLMLLSRLTKSIQASLTSSPHSSTFPAELKDSATLPWSPPAREYLEQLVDRWMEDVSIWYPRDFNQLRAALERECAASSMANGPALILIDSLSIYDAPLYLSLQLLNQKSSTGTTGTTMGRTPQPPPTRDNLALKTLLPLLHRLTKLLNVQIFIVTHLSSNVLSHRPSMPIQGPSSTKAQAGSTSTVGGNGGGKGESSSTEVKSKTASAPPLSLPPLLPPLQTRLTLLPSYTLNILPYPSTTSLSSARRDRLRDDALSKRSKGSHGWREVVEVDMGMGDTQILDYQAAGGGGGGGGKAKVKVKENDEGFETKGKGKRFEEFEIRIRNEEVEVLWN